MPSFAISPAALTEIRRIIAGEMHADPAVSLVDCGPEMPVPKIVEAAVRAPGDLDANVQAQEFLRDKFSRERIQLELNVMINSRSECRAEDLEEIDGVLFAIAAYVRELLRPYTLTFREGRFYLQGEEGLVGCLTGIKGMNIWPS